jgi:DNA-binding response OmpR family regulator
MTFLLMLDADQRLVSMVSRALLHEGVSVIGASSIAQGIATLAQQTVDCVLIDCDVLEPEQLAPFEHLPVILTTSFLEPAGEHRLLRDAPLLRKPFTGAQLLSVLRDTCGSSAPEVLGLVDSLRRAHSAGESLAVHVGGARVFVEHGEIVHAEHGTLHGEAALAEALAQSHERAVRFPPHPVPRTIARPFQALMLDLLRGIEEREQSESTGRYPHNVTPLHKGPRS